MDILGLAILLIVVLLIIFLFYRYLRRTDLIPKWPTALAMVTEVESLRGGLPGSRSLTSDRCKVFYAFSVADTAYEGWFVLMTDEQGFADDTSEKLCGKELTVRYDPKNPKNSILVDNLILGKEVIQSRSLLDFGMR